MTEVKGASVVIVGGGVTGLSAAWWLAQAGVDVLVVEKGIVGWEASGRNGGGCGHLLSPLYPEMLRLWPIMDELLGYPTEFSPNRINVAVTEQQLVDNTHSAESAQRHGYRSELLDSKQCRELIPLIGDNVAGAHFYHFGGHANPHRTVQAYAWAMQDHGGRLMQHCRVVGFRTEGERVVCVETERGPLGCDQLLIAAGPHTGRLSAMLGQEVPMQSARAEMIVTEPLPIMACGGVDGNGLHGRQTLRGNLAFGGGPHEWLKLSEAGGFASPSTPLLGHIGRRLIEMMPKTAHARIIRSWAGIIENTPDGRPVIDRLSTFPNVVVATMSSVGFGLSPSSGRAIRDVIVDGTCSFADIYSFRLARFARLEPDWRELQGWIALSTE
ncbi:MULTISPECIES: FAD-binding oxidoreductase [unclassified Mesorhizobium]|uniref:NAD(P)/FAD-dependent oxidoreductase n=1 Tax=unclassified Mesorhizobium TaxID=325217 RepID=UPI000FCA977E|nr:MULTISPECIES: FAD-binding oxidoreductase [unclassified Mesorhizobium]RVC45305.1 FAD-binding oxidoreductase [Mesorhizobium sp. M4A.F.Ca.ET.090.04.2.1]RWD53729.1 MAG: FAD-binding oxidoreductase [Mesorhizobium sp.]RWJ22613.1 MAG: FAD-binding oxidoreductase [Mesorhizobium sp.]RWN15082.1 MAG: FAD-binding oxidoreductase [Mesorhizobium sp.]RWN21004.1 MAG: FAD-binding oxidoreductase [Mesorhizobium sp.]